MERERLRELLAAVQAGAASPEEALERLAALPFEDLGFARVDHHRALRKGFPEVIFCAGKTPADFAAIARSILERNPNLLATRAAPEHFAALAPHCPAARYNERGRTIAVAGRPRPPRPGRVLILTAGTSDIPVAEEARETAQLLGCAVETVYDAGVAGIHRLLGEVEKLRQARALIVVAGMEGALASVVGGLVERPVIAVPTSVGYGASFGGLAPLLTMLNSCAPGVAVTNIDNGFGAAYLAALICGD